MILVVGTALLLSGAVAHAQKITALETQRRTLQIIDGDPMPEALPAGDYFETSSDIIFTPPGRHKQSVSIVWFTDSAMTNHCKDRPTTPATFLPQGWKYGWEFQHIKHEKHLPIETCAITPRGTLEDIIIYYRADLNAPDAAVVPQFLQALFPTSVASPAPAPAATPTAAAQ